MKKLLSILLVGMLLFVGGCSCSSTTPIPFQYLWNGEAKPTPPTTSLGFKEELTYDVTFEKTYAFDDYDYSLDEDVSEVIDVDYTGTYTSRILHTSINRTKINSDIIDDNTLQVLHQTTELNIQAKYKKVGEQEYTTYNDKVTTESYFCLHTKEFSPVYSITKASMSTVSMLSDSAEIQKIQYISEVLYNQDSYTVTIKHYDEDANMATAEPTSTDEYSKDYSKGTLIDNTQLLFALRNFYIEESDQSDTFDVVQTAYRNAETLKITYVNDSATEYSNNGTNDISINGITPTENIRVETKAYSFGLDTTTNAGMKQFVFIQKTANNNLPNRSLVIEYVEPLCTYSSFYHQGALRYKLRTVNFG